MIEVKGLVKDYGALRAVDGVSFTVQRGDILGFLGPNGAGKSTTMKIITGFLRPTAGLALVDGHDVTAEPVTVKRLVGYLPENAPAYPEMTVEEFLDFIAETRGFRTAARKTAASRARRRTSATSGPCAGSRSRPSPRATNSASASPRRCSTIRRCWCSTSQPTASTPTRSTRCATSSSRWPPPRPSSSPPTSSRRSEAICNRIDHHHARQGVVTTTRPRDSGSAMAGARLEEIFRSLTQTDT